MANNQLLGGFLLLSGATTIYYALFIKGVKLDKASETLTYAPVKAPDILLNDDRTTFTGPTTTIPPTNTNTTNETPIDNSIKGYPMPSDINMLQQIGGQVWIITKPDVSAFGEGGRAGFPVTVNFSEKTLVYKNNQSGVLNTEVYEAVKNKIVLSDKKYLK